MQPLLLSTQFDFQGVVIIIALIAGFIRWLWENWQQRQEGMKRETPPDPEEQRLREAAWRRQTGQGAPPPLPPVAPSPWTELREAWQQLKETAMEPVPAPARQSRPRPAPPLPVSPPRQPAVRAKPPSSGPGLDIPAATAGVARETYQSPERAAEGPVLAAVRHLRRDPALMRQAIVMQEILGPPKALQTSGDLAI